MITSLLLISFCVASVTFTISVTSIFAGVREAVGSIHPKLDELIHCPYCLSHYVTFLILLFGDHLFAFSSYVAVNLILTTFTVVGMVGLIHFVLLRAYEPVARAALQRKLDKLNQKTN